MKKLIVDDKEKQEIQEEVFLYYYKMNYSLICDI